PLRLIVKPVETHVYLRSGGVHSARQGLGVAVIIVPLRRAHNPIGPGRESESISDVFIIDCPIGKSLTEVHRRSSGRPCRTSWSLGSLRSSGASRSRNTLRSLRSLRPLCSLWALWPLLPCLIPLNRGFAYFAGRGSVDDACRAVCEVIAPMHHAVSVRNCGDSMPKNQQWGSREHTEQE